MNIEIVRADGKAEWDLITRLRQRAEEVQLEVDEVVRKILLAVKEEGFPAVNRYSQQFDRAEVREISIDELKRAYEGCSKTLIEAMEHSAANIRDYNEHILMQSSEWTSPDGGRVGRIVKPLERVGVYVPGGTAAYPSSVLMNIVPAKVAGVKEIIMVTPPTDFMSHEVLAAAYIAGVDRVFAVGGVQAIGALTYGAGPIPKVDKLTGPGSAYVAAAKRMVYGTVDIDMVAGPSEVLVIADETANADYVAADLLSQAEHDELASAILLTTSKNLAQQVIASMEQQMKRLSRQEIMEKSLANFGAVVVCSSLSQCAAISNVLAPEHLEIATAEPRALLPEIQHAGAIFLGSHTPESLGDYMAGPNHVLPTSGTARFFAPLSVDAFITSMSVLEFDRESLRSAATQTVAFAKIEHLTAHANSIQIRFEGEQL